MAIPNAIQTPTATPQDDSGVVPGSFVPLNKLATPATPATPNTVAAPEAAPVTPATPADSDVVPGSFKPLASLQKPSEEAMTGTNKPEQPGFVQRAIDVSGAAGMGHLAASTVGYLGTMPMRTYHRVQGLEQAYDALKQGDLKKATMIANTLATGPDDPITKMAVQLLKMPFDEAVEAYKSFKLNPSATEANLVAAQHGIRSIPLIGAAAEQIGHTIADDLHENNWRGLSGDLVGIVPALLFGAENKAAQVAETSTVEGGAEAAQYARESAIRPSQRMVGRTPVPVTALQNENPSMAAQGLEKVASNPAAKQAAFAAERTQPAAVNATVNNLEDVARNHIQAVRDELGKKEPFETDMSTIRKQSGAMKDAAQEIYQKFDKASDAEQDAYKTQQKLKEEAFNKDQDAKQTAFEEDQAAKKETFDKAQDAKKKAATPEKPYKPDKFKAEKFEGEDFVPDERPLTFRELQTKRSNALDQMREGTSPEAYRAAKNSLEATEGQMDEFAKRNSDTVSPAEYDLANTVRKAANKHDFIADRLNIDTGTGRIPASITRGGLKALPRSFDKRFGDGAFNKYLGPEGLKNYNAVRDVLENPEEQQGFMHFANLVTQHTLGTAGGAAAGYALGGAEGAAIGGVAGPVLRYTAGRIAENLLFNPEYGQTVLNAWRAAKGLRMPAPVGKAVAAAPLVPQVNATHTWSPETGIVPVQ